MSAYFNGLMEMADVSVKDFIDSIKSRPEVVSMQSYDGDTLLVKYIGEEQLDHCVYLVDHHPSSYQQGYPLHNAVKTGNKCLVLLLLHAGVNINEKDSNGKTPLHYAVSDGEPDLCLLLLNHLADPNLVDNGGRSPLELAVNKKPFPYSIVDRLYRNGGDIEDSKVPANVKAALEEIKSLADKEDVGYDSEEEYESEEEIEDPDL